MWAVITAIFYGISSLFGGEGSFRRTLAFVGYGYAPQILGGLISMVFTFLFVSSFQVPRVADPNEIANVAMQPDAGSSSPGRYAHRHSLHALEREYLDLRCQIRTDLSR